MQTNINIAVIGGTGKSGKYLFKSLLSKGFNHKLLLRNPGVFTETSHLTKVVSGDVRNYEAVETLLQGCHAVISMLGQPKGEPPIFSAATKNIIQAMHQHNIKRYIVTTGLSVNAAGDAKSPTAVFGTDWMYKNYPATTHDKQLELEELVKSNIDWTLVRLPLIAQTDNNAAIAVNLTDCPGDSISATSLANFVIQQVFDDTYIKKAPFIANK